MKITIPLITNCARCGGNHENVIAFSLQGQPIIIDEDTMTHYATCPSNGQPILVLFLPEPLPA